MNPVGPSAAQISAEKLALLRDAPRLVARAIAERWARYPASPAAKPVPDPVPSQLPVIPLLDLRRWVISRQLTPRQAAETLGFGYLEFTAALRAERTLRGRLPR